MESLPKGIMGYYFEEWMSCVTHLKNDCEQHCTLISVSELRTSHDVIESWVCSVIISLIRDYR